MSTPVYVWPFKLVTGVFTDLHGDQSVPDGFNMFYATLMKDGKRHEQVTLEFKAVSPFVVDGLVDVTAEGEAFPGGAEAERSAVVAMVEALRTGYQFYPCDYNMAAVIKKRPLFNAMRAAYLAYRESYGELDACTKEMNSSLLLLCSELSSWLGTSHPAVELPETVPVHAFVAAMSEQATDVDIIIKDSTFLVEMLERREEVPDCQRRFDETVPHDVVVDWERSYCTLKSVYNEAVKKFGCVFSPIRVTELNNGQAKASVRLSASPHIFHGPVAGSENAAVARLFFVVIEHVNTHLGCPIFDLHYRVKLYQDYCIGRFDKKMDGLERCGLKLHRLVGDTGSMWVRNLGELTNKMSPAVAVESVYDPIQQFATKLAVIRRRFETAWVRFVELNTNSDEIGRQLDGVGNNAAGGNNA